MSLTSLGPSTEAIRNNQTLHPLAFTLVQERFPDIKWHSHADSPDSSQAFALSAFVPLVGMSDKDSILDRFVTSALLTIPPNGERTWEVIPEFVQRDLLGETGLGVPTNVDVLLVADDVVVCVESKFRVDALEGFGRCSQFTSGTCLGFHGTGSDTKGTDSPCRLGVRDGRRDARKYWELGQRYFRDEVFAEQKPPEVCPYRDNYQLMRNYLLAAEYANRESKPYFGVIGIVPSSRSSALAGGVERFKAQMIPEANATQVNCVAYEDYIEVLAAGSDDARQLAAFLESLLD